MTIFSLLTAEILLGHYLKVLHRRYRQKRKMKMSNKKIILASNNKGKIREIQEILSPLGYEIISMKDSGIDIDIEENGKTLKKMQE